MTYRSEKIKAQAQARRRRVAKNVVGAIAPCANCTTSPWCGTCPRCYAATGTGCGHGPVCELCLSQIRREAD